MTTAQVTQPPRKFLKQVVEYDILQIQPTDQFVALYSYTDENQQECLLVVPLRAIGTALVRTLDCPEHGPRKESLRWYQVVGLELIDGQWVIVDEDDHYLGMASKGDDFTYFRNRLRAGRGPDYEVPVRYWKAGDGEDPRCPPVEV